MVNYFINNTLIIIKRKKKTTRESGIHQHLKAKTTNLLYSLSYPRIKLTAPSLLTATIHSTPLLLLICWPSQTKPFALFFFFFFFFWVNNFEGYKGSGNFQYYLAAHCS
jgi:hypothetical protein